MLEIFLLGTCRWSELLMYFGSFALWALFSPFLSQQSSVYPSHDYLSFTEGFSSELFASKVFAHLKRLERFILNSVIKNFIITIRCLSCSRSEFSNVLD